MKEFIEYILQFGNLNQQQIDFISKKGKVLELTTLPTIILLAFMEEVIFRTYPLITLKKKIGILTALIITSVLFGLYHVVFGWGMTGFFSTSIWGFALGLLAIYSNGISMPIVFHSAGNLVQSALGMTGSSYGIWKVVSMSGQQINNFTKNQGTIIIAQLVLLILIILCLKFVLRDKTSGNKYIAASGADTAQHQQ